MNRCRRCNREISDPNAVFGWRCAEILGVTETLSGMGQDTFDKFLDGVTKAHRLFGNGNLTDEQYKRIYSAFAKQSIWKGVDEKKVKEAKKESYPLISKDEWQEAIIVRGKGTATKKQKEILDNGHWKDKR